MLIDTLFMMFEESKILNEESFAIPETDFKEGDSFEVRTATSSFSMKANSHKFENFQKINEEIKNCLVKVTRPFRHLQVIHLMTTVDFNQVTTTVMTYKTTKHFAGFAFGVEERHESGTETSFHFTLNILIKTEP